MNLYQPYFNSNESTLFIFYLKKWLFRHNMVISHKIDEYVLITFELGSHSETPLSVVCNHLLLFNGNYTLYELPKKGLKSSSASLVHFKQSLTTTSLKLNAHFIAKRVTNLGNNYIKMAQKSS